MTADIEPGIDIETGIVFAELGIILFIYSTQMIICNYIDDKRHRGGDKESYSVSRDVY